MASEKIRTSKVIFDFRRSFQQSDFDHVFEEVIFDVLIILKKTFDVLTLRCSDFRRSDPLSRKLGFAGNFLVIFLQI
jgi:hypothetical protein